jgi:hypothetical protein
MVPNSALTASVIYNTKAKVLRHIKKRGLASSHSSQTLPTEEAVMSNFIEECLRDNKYLLVEYLRQPKGMHFLNSKMHFALLRERLWPGHKSPHEVASLLHAMHV